MTDAVKMLEDVIKAIEKQRTDDRKYLIDNVRRLNPTLALAGLLLCRTDSRARLSADLHAHLRETYGDRVFSAVVRDTVRLREAWSHSQPITRYDGRGIGAADYRAATAELVERLG